MKRIDVNNQGWTCEGWGEMLKKVESMSKEEFEENVRKKQQEIKETIEKNKKNEEKMNTRNK